MKSKKAWIIGGIILAAVIAAVAIMGSGGEEVEVVKASRGTFTLMVEETGYVEAANDREVQATAAAQVRDLLVESGDKVMLGQLLIKLSSPFSASPYGNRAGNCQTKRTVASPGS